MISKRQIFNGFILFSLFHLQHTFATTLNIEPVKGKKYLSVGSFNIRDFGMTKASRPSVMNALVAIVSSYDLIFIQELSNIPDDSCGPNTGKVICFFQQQLNDSSNKQFELLVTPRDGNEQMAIVYNVNRVELAEHGLYADPKESFARKPYIVRFRVGSGLIYFVTAHLAHYQAKKEIYALDDLANTLERRDRDIVILGDFNASGSYFDENHDWSGLHLLKKGYHQLIEDGADTTVSSQNDYTYDRILTSSSVSRLLDQKKGEVFHFDRSLEGGISMGPIQDEGCSWGYLECGATDEQAALYVSDHYPVGFKLSIE